MFGNKHKIKLMVYLIICNRIKNNLDYTLLKRYTKTNKEPKEDRNVSN